MTSTAQTLSYDNAPVAFGLVCAAGAATALGAAIVFFPHLVKMASQRVLAASLGFSAGVMTYVSFVEIFRKSVVAFKDAGWNEAYSYVFATSSFFGGVLLMKVIDIGVHYVLSHHHKDDNSHIQITHTEGGIVRIESEVEEEIVTPHCVGCAEDPIAELEEWHQMADEVIQKKEEAEVNSKDGGDGGHTNGIRNRYEKRTTTETTALSINRGSQLTNGGDEDELENGLSPPSASKPQKHRRQQSQQTPPVDEGVEMAHVHSPQDTEGKIVMEGCIFDKNASPADMLSLSVESSFQPPPPPSLSETKEKKRLVKMGLSAALAIALHNFPEGLATFVAALEDPRVGAVLAIAIGIHNIPEGMCVSFPIYYATGNRLRAFKWGVLSGLSEPIAAGLGWLVLAKSMNKNVYGVLFGWTAGMMVIISLKELVPTAHRYDPKDTVVTNSIIAGMVVIALSLVLFKI